VSVACCLFCPELISAFFSFFHLFIPHTFTPSNTHTYTAMSLADDFLADLDYEDAEAIVSTSSDAQATSSSSHKGPSNGMDIDYGDFDDEDGEHDEGEEGDVEMPTGDQDAALESMLRDVQKAKNARDIAKLMDSSEMKGILSDIAHFQSEAAAKGSDVTGMVEDDPEYQLIVKANTITVAIDNEILVVHKVGSDRREGRAWD